MAGARSKASNKDTKLAVKDTGKLSKKAKLAAKDPNKPKRPASAFFVFMEDFRKSFKEQHPENKSVATVGKAGGKKWKSMSISEKAPFQAKADKRKTDYAKNLEAYNKKQVEGPADDEESDKSKSEVHDEDDSEDQSEDNDEDE